MSEAAARGGPQLIPRPPGSEPGPAAPWAHLPAEDRVVTIDAIRTAFAGRQGAPSAVEGRPHVRPAAVLAPFYEHEGEVHVVLTRRSSELRSHTGEVSFPGGAADNGETPEAAARREAHEEIGLERDAAEVIGELDHLTTVTSRSFIVPLVGILRARPDGLRASPAEVAAILHVPLSELLLDGVYREERWRWPDRWGDAPHSIFFFELYGDTVWGATAAMLRQFLALALGIGAGIEHA